MIKLLIFLFFIVNIYTQTLEIYQKGQRRAEKKPFLDYPKFFFGDYLTTQQEDFLPFHDSYTMQLEQQTSSYYSDFELIPGNTYYYYYTLFYEGTPVLDQREPFYRLIYISSNPVTGEIEVYIDGEKVGGPVSVTNIIVHDNWGYPGTPLPPQSISAVFSWEKDKWCVRLSWTFPKFRDKEIIDVLGGSYRIYRSTYIKEFSETDPFSEVPYTETTYLDENIDFSLSTTYYYRLVTADAYDPPMLSKPSPPVKPTIFMKPLTVVFNLNTIGIQNVVKAFVAGDLINWTKKEMNNNYDGTFRLSYFDPTRIFYDETQKRWPTIEYKYIINDNVWEKDFPKIYNGPNRRVELIDDNYDGIVFLYDTFNVPTTTTTASNLPKELISFYTQPEHNLIKLICEIDPVEVEKIKDILIFSSKDEKEGYELFIQTSPCVYRVEITTPVSNGTTVYYRIQIKLVDGDSSYLSDSLKTIPPFYGDYIPKYVRIISSDTELINYTATHGIETGEVNLRWTVPEGNKDIGPPLFYIVRLSTYPIYSFDDFKFQPLYIKKKSPSPLTSEFLRVKLRDEQDKPHTGFPGLFYTIGTVYGINYISLSKPKIAVAPVSFNIKQPTEVTKWNRTTGLKPDDFPKAAVAIKPNSLRAKANTANIIIRNYHEIYYSDLIEKVKEANKHAKLDPKIGFIPENDLSSPPLWNNTIYSFEIYTENDKEYFVDKNNDGLPDSYFLKPVDIIIPYMLNYPLESMRLYRLDTKNNRWYRVKDVNIRCLGHNRLKIENLKHFGIFGLFRMGGSAEDLSQAMVYPNPFVPYDDKLENGEFSAQDPYYRNITFCNLTQNTEILIYNISAELVHYHKLQAKNDDELHGIYRWNIKEKEIASGLYICLLKDETLKGKRPWKKILKLVLIK